MFFSHMSPIGTDAASSTYMPGSEIVPPMRTSGKHAASADSLPTASTTTSAPRQLVSSSTTSSASVSFGLTGDRAEALGELRAAPGTMSTATTLPAPSARAAITVQRPTGPQPTTATTSPGRMSVLRTAS